MALEEETKRVEEEKLRKCRLFHILHDLCDTCRLFVLLQSLFSVAEDVRLIVKDTVIEVLNDIGEEWMDDCVNLGIPIQEEEDDDCVMLGTEPLNIYIYYYIVFSH